MQERRKSRLRLAGVRLGRSPAGSSSSSSSSRPGARSGSAGRRLQGLPVRHHPARWSARPRKRRAEEGRGRLARSASEPALWYAAAPQGLSPPSPPPPPLERPHTFYDVFSPEESTSAASPLPDDRKPREDAKVVVSVTVQGSTGPVKPIVRLGASIGETIAAVVERYGREGRSPRLDPAAAEAFQLHHSHFSLQSLNKNDKIGDAGGRNFYLHKNDGSNGRHLQIDESSASLSGGEGTHSYGGQLAYHQFVAVVIKKLDKIGRRAKRVWRILLCDFT